ncbi:MAG: STAS domain-containing protein, partial [Actinobacteria bacterium]|nr:STAS domain-containing protein [Actinomycetota bacterium]
DTAPRLRDALADLAGEGGVRVTLDLVGMTFIDSTGLSVLVTGLKRLREIGGNLVLQSPSATTMKVLEITGLTSVFAIEEEATCAINSSENPVGV